MKFLPSVPLFFFLILCSLQPVSAQNLHRCGTDEHLEHQLATHPQFRDLMDRHETQYQQWLGSADADAQRAACDVFVVPVVVHIIYDDAVTNISDAQVQSQITILNQDYRRLPNTPGAGAGFDTRIQFALATLDPTGQPTTGITRTQSPLTNHTQAEESLLKGLITWNTSKYLNIWVVKNIASGSGDEILGYANPPGAPNPATSGVVVSGKYFGNTGSVQPPYNRGRTAVHEVGHFLGLLHTFGTDGVCDGTSSTNCANSGDRVCDTPAEKDAKYGCPTGVPNSCVDGLCEGADAIRNYMNYVDDICMDEFTRGQIDRMHFFLTSTLAGLVSPANLTSTGVINPTLLETTPIARFKAESRSGCGGATVQFTDQSIGCVQSYSWSFPGGTPATSTDKNPVVTYSLPGAYIAILTVTNGAGTNTLTLPNQVVITQDRATVPLAESFETGGFPPAGWQVVNEDGLGTWSKSGAAASQGNAAAVMANFTSNSCNSPNDLVTPVFDLRGATTATLSFDYSYRAKNVDPDDADQLIVQVSEDCGQTWKTPALFEKAGFLLAVDFTLVANSSFVPAVAADWKNVSIDVKSFVGKDNVRFRFRVFGKGGQNLWLDNIVFDSNVAIDQDENLSASLNIFPNPVTQHVELTFSLESPADVQGEWLDMQGRSVARTQWTGLLPGQNQVTWEGAEISGLPAGIYLVRLSTPNGSVFRKVVKE